MKKPGSPHPSTANPAARRRRAENPETSSPRAEQAGDEFARFFDQSRDLMCIAGLDGYFRHLNPAWTSRLGWTLEELKAKPFLDFVHADDRDATQEEFGKLAEGAETTLFENRYLHEGGSYRWLQWNAWPVAGRRLIYAAARDVTRQKRLEREILQIVDLEKERLGRELHDGLCQSLAGIAALSSTLSRRLAARAESAASATAAEIARLLNETIVQARDLARGLGPVGLTEAGLDGALETLALNVEHLFRVSCRLECERPFLRLCREIEAHLFRIAQEAVRNAVDHGKATRIEIGLIAKDGEGLLIIRDDGVGLPREVRTLNGLGMHTMSYRARLIGGSLQVRRRGRRGTAIFCTFPLRESSATREEADHVGDYT